jgi:hypothetical protein
LINQNFILDSKIALEILKTRVAVATRLYSSNVESIVRSNKNYASLLAMRKNKDADRKKTALLTKKLLNEQLKIMGIPEEDFAGQLEGIKKNYAPYQQLVVAEKIAFKMLEPQLKEIPVYGWMEDVRGLGLRYAVKLLSMIRDIQRFENPSKLRTYCGCAPGQVRRAGLESNFNPELKGVLLGQVAENFIKNKSQYKHIYDEKKTYYLGFHPEALAEKTKGKKYTKEDWTKLKIHNYAKKTMINRFLVDLWMAWWISEGKEPPVNPYIANIPGHTLEPMVVPYTT